MRLGLGWHVSDEHLGSDTPFFRDAAAELLDSGRYTETSGESVKSTLKHPPGFVLVLAAGEAVGIDRVTEQRAMLALIEVLGVALLGLAGFRIGGSVVGTLAAGVAAVHPMWTQPGVVIMSESIYLTVVSAAILAAVVHLERRTPLTAAGTGALVAGAALVRSEALLALILMAPVIVLVSNLDWRHRGRLAVGFMLGAAVVLGPWLIRNTVVSGAPVISTNAGVTLAGSNCDQTYSGANQGGFALRCGLAGAVGARSATTESPGPAREVDIDSRMRDAALDYARQHPRQALTTSFVRVLRTWTPAHLEAQVHLDTAEGRLPRWQTAGRWMHGALLVPAVVGAVALHRTDGRRALVLAVFVVQVSVTSALVYGSARMRSAAEPSIALYAAFGVATVIGWLGRRDVAAPTEVGTEGAVDLSSAPRRRLAYSPAPW